MSGFFLGLLLGILAGIVGTIVALVLFVDPEQQPQEIVHKPDWKM